MSEIIYPDCEKELKEEMDKLYENVHDKYGFYPYYTKQKLKILYLGRESRNLNVGTNYIEYLYYCYTKRKEVGDEPHTIPINRHAFHRRLLKISYGLINDKNWSDIPNASEIANSFGTENGISFAFTNLSKISNNNKDSAHIGDDFRGNIETTKELIKKEIYKLKPNIIIGMNLIHRSFKNKNLKPIEPGDFINNPYQPDTNDNSLYIGNLDEDKIVYIDSYHFSARNKKDERDFFDLIRNCRAKARSYLSTLSDNADHGRNGL